METYAPGTLPEADAKLITRSVMVADHLLVPVSPDRQPAIIAALADLGYMTKPARCPNESFLRVTVPADDAEAMPRFITAILEGIEGVAVEPDYLVFTHRTPNDPLYAQQWSLDNQGQTGGTEDADVNAPRAWESQTGSATVIVAVLDTGIDMAHPDLVDNIYSNPGETADGIDSDSNGYTDDINGWNFYQNNNDATDCHFHGTHVAGTVGARGNNGVGVAGIAWNTRILPVRVFSLLGTGTLSDAVTGIRFAADQGARVINASWGFHEGSNLLSDAISYAGTKNCLIVASAGNDGSDNGIYPVYPASIDLENLISVAATDHDDNLAGFSNHGTNVHIAAPGVGIISTTPGIPTLGMMQSGILPDYGHSSGTSMAAPHVAGAAALLLSKNPSLSPAQLKEMLIERARFKIGLTDRLFRSSRLDMEELLREIPQPALPSLQFHRVAWREKGTPDGMARPGEEIELDFGFVNTGTQTAVSSFLNLEILSGQAVFTTGQSSSMGDIPGAGGKTLSPLPTIRISPTSPDNLSVAIRATLTWSGASPVSTVLEVPVVNLQDIQASERLPFQISEVMPAPTPNLVYMLSPSSWRLLAFDTALAKFTGYQDLGTKPSDPGARVFGGMAVNSAGDRIYVSVPKLKQIRVLSLPSLADVTVLTTDFEVSSLAIDARNRLFASDHACTAPLRQLSLVNGSVIGIHSGDIPTGNNLLSREALLKTNAARTKLYAASKFIAMPAPFQVWDVGAPVVSYIGQSNALMGYITDYAIDAENERIFSTHQAIDGLEVSRFNPQSPLEFLPFEPEQQGAAVSFTPGKNYVLAASTSINLGCVHRYKRDTGEYLGAYRVLPNTHRAGVLPRSLCVTENGRAVYIGTSEAPYSLTAEDWGYHYLNLIGATSLDVTVPPPSIPPAMIDLVSASLQDFGGNSDGIPNPGESVSLQFTLKNLGEATSSAYTLSVASLDPRAVVSQTSLPIPGLGGGGIYLTETIPVVLDPAVPNGTDVSFDLTLSAPGAPTFSFRHTFTVITTPSTATPAPPAITPARLTAIVASPVLNEVYIADSSEGRVIAVDTTLGGVRQVAAIPDEKRERLHLNSPIHELGMAISPDGTRLAIFERNAKDIHIFRTPDLAWMDVFTLPQINSSVVFDSRNDLHVSGRLESDATHSQILRVSGTSGEILSTYGSQFSRPSMLTASPDGNRIAYSYRDIDQMEQSRGTDIFDSSENAEPSLMFSLPECYFFLVFIGNSAWINTYSGIREFSLLSGSFGRSNPAISPYVSNLLLTPNNRFVCSNDEVIREYQTLTPKDTIISDRTRSPNAGTLRTNGVAITPDGRISYLTSLASQVIGTSILVSSQSGFGIIGRSVSLEMPSDLPVKLLSSDMSDPAPANANGFSEPGETISIIPYFRNTATTAVSNVTVTLRSSNPKAEVTGMPTRDFSRVNAFTDFQPATPFTVALSGTVADSESLGLSLTITYGTVSQTIPLPHYGMKYQLASVEADFELGETLAHSSRNLIYAVDKTNCRLLAINTDLGTVSAWAKLVAPPGKGELALSPDGSRIAISLPDSNRIQVLDAYELTATDVIHLDHSPQLIAYGADGAIFSTDYAHNQLARTDPETGQTHALVDVSIADALKPNFSLRQPFSFQTRLISNGIVPGKSVVVPLEMLPLAGSESTLGGRGDFAFDPDGDRIHYSGHAPGGGFTTRSRRTGETTKYYEPAAYTQGASITLHSSQPFLYVGATDHYSNDILRIDRQTGRILARFVTSGTSDRGYLKERSLEVTPNGRIFYASEISTVPPASPRHVLHLFGVNSLELSLPPAAIPMDSGPDRSANILNPIRLSTELDFSPSSAIAWRKASGPGTVGFSSNGGITTAGFSHPGIYRIEARSTIPGTTAADSVWVSVQPALASLEGRVIRRIATTLPQKPAIFRVTRCGDLSQSLRIKLIYGGSATPNLDFRPLKDELLFDPGISEAEVSIVPIQYSGKDIKELTIRLLPVDGYTVDPATYSFSIMEGHFKTWLADLKAEHPGIEITPEGDNNNNGLSNLMEYAMGADPFEATTQPRYFTTKNPRLRLHFQRRQYLTDATLEIEMSTDMISWSSMWNGEPAVKEVYGFGGGSLPLDVGVELSEEASAHRNVFLRIKVTEIP